MEDKVAAGNVEAAEGNPAPVKKSSKSKAKTQQKKSTRPPISGMVTTAIKELKDRKGSSLQAIKKYIVATYKVDVEKIAPFIRKYLKTAVATGVVVQTKGKGASGSFKLAADKPEAKPKAKKTASRSATKEKVWVSKTTTARKPAATKKTAAAKKASDSLKKAAQKKTAAKPAVERKRAAAEPKSPKAKKAVKAPAAKTKTPKPKKAAGTKAVKAAAKK